MSPQHRRGGFREGTGLPAQRTAWLGGLCLALAAVVGVGSTHEAGQQTPHPEAPVHEGHKPPHQLSMEELHQHGGVPQRWKFSVPDGDPKAGRDVFVTLECYQCHEIQGETFPSGSASRPRTGPALTGMGAHHPAEYFAESILNPNAIVVTGPGYTDAAGRSIGPTNMRVMTAAG